MQSTEKAQNAGRRIFSAALTAGFQTGLPYRSLSRASTDSAMIVMTIPQTPIRVGTSAKMISPASMADVGSAPDSRIAVFDASTYFMAEI